MSQQTVTGESCQHCKRVIEKDQPIVRLLKAVFHGACLVAWCETNLKRKQQMAAVLKEPL